MTGKTTSGKSKSSKVWLATLSEASAGALGQLFSTLLLYPLDTSKTRVQSRMGNDAKKGKGGEIEEERCNGETGTRDHEEKTKENTKEWFLSLYTGIETKVGT
jgi:hypothetical protein